MVDFNDLIKKADEIPEDFENVFISHLRNTMKEAYKNEGEEFFSFVDEFLKEIGHEIYEYHLKTFTKEELWKTVLIGKTAEFKKMMSFVVDYNKFLEKLMVKFENKKLKEPLAERKEWNKKMIKLGEEIEDEWTTE